MKSSKEWEDLTNSQDYISKKYMYTYPFVNQNYLELNKNFDPVWLSFKRIFNYVSDKQNNKSTVTSDAQSLLLKGYKSIYDAEIFELLPIRNYLPYFYDNCGEFAVGNDTKDLSNNSLTINGIRVGGSSGGTALSVQNDISDLGIGSDTGGSIRDVVFLFDELYGFKPSYGMITRYGMIPLCNKFDTVGLISKEIYIIMNSFMLLIRGKKDQSLNDRKLLLKSKNNHTEIINWKTKAISTQNGLLNVKYSYKLEKILKDPSIARAYVLYCGAYLYSNLQRYLINDYQNTGEVNLSPQILRPKKIDLKDYVSKDVQNRYNWGLLFLKNSRIRSIVEGIIKDTENFSKQLFKQYDYIVTETRQAENDSNLIFSNIVGACSVSRGKITIISKPYYDLNLLRICYFINE